MHGAGFTEVHFTQREEAAARWLKCKYHTKSSSEQSSESIDLCTDAKQELLSINGEFYNEVCVKVSLGLVGNHNTIIMCSLKDLNICFSAFDYYDDYLLPLFSCHVSLMCLCGGEMVKIPSSCVYTCLWSTPVGPVDSGCTLETDCSDTFIPFFTLSKL